VAFQQYHSAYHRAKEKQQQVIKDAMTPNNVPVDHSLAGLSVKKIAEKLGISIGEVRRRKANGTL
jgi:DNA-binding NarL/FixJ family response regulator